MSPDEWHGAVPPQVGQVAEGAGRRLHPPRAPVGPAGGRDDARAHLDLAVEVLGLYTDRELREKLEEYRATGTPLVWVLDPEHRTATVYHDRHEGQTVEPPDPDDVLTGGDAVPSLAVPLRKAFEAPEEPDDA